MGSAITRQPARCWAVQLRAAPPGLVLSCPQCGTQSLPAGAGAHAAVLAHLAQHARRNPLAPHLRTCQCGAQNCPWHPRQRGCDGSILLTLTRNRAGNTWRLADLCRACATTTTYSAAVPEPTNGSPSAAPTHFDIDDGSGVEEHTCWADGLDP